MEKKTKHFDMRLTPAINDALTELAKRADVDKTAFLVEYIRKQAKKQGIPT